MHHITIWIIFSSSHFSFQGSTMSTRKWELWHPSRTSLTIFFSLCLRLLLIQIRILSCMFFWSRYTNLWCFYCLYCNLPSVLHVKDIYISICFTTYDGVQKHIWCVRLKQLICVCACMCTSVTFFCVPDYFIGFWIPLKSKRYIN